MILIFLPGSCFFVAFATFVACLVLPLELGILVGIGINLLYILYHAARPKITVERLTVSNPFLKYNTLIGRASRSVAVA